MHYLLNIVNFDNLYHHPKLGTSWEGFALEDLALDKLFIIFPGKESFPLTPVIEAVGLEYYLFST